MKQVISITGAGGSVGCALIKHFLSQYTNIEIRAIDRSEIAISNLLDMSRFFPNLKVFFADIIECSKIEDILKSTDIIIHCAAIKHVITGHEFPTELASQNIISFCNIIRIAKKHRIKKIILCSTDKAATPSSVMGASKLLLEKIACFSSDQFIKISSIRFGNILNSSGSIIPKIISKLSTNEEIKINHPEMTRYFLVEQDFIDVIDFAIANMNGGEIFIPNFKSMKIIDLASSIIEAFCKKNHTSSESIQVKILDNPHNENIDERMINHDEIKFLYYLKNHFVLKPLEETKELNLQYNLCTNLLSSSLQTLPKKKVNKLIADFKLYSS